MSALTTLREKLLEQPEEKAKEIALSLELFTTGSLDIFGHRSTVDLNKRVVVFDIHGLGEQLKPIGHMVITDTMLSNSEFVVMLNQAASDREKLARLLNISEQQMGYITNAAAGCGLIKYGSALAPFVNRFPHNTELYRLMTTRPGEGHFSEGQA